MPALLQKRPRGASSQSGSAASLKTPGETMPQPLRPLQESMAPVANCIGDLGKDKKKKTPIRPLCHYDYVLQWGRVGLRKQTFATVTKPHGMTPIFRSNVSGVLIEEPLHERHVVDFLRYTEWGSGTGVYLRAGLFSSKLSTYLRIFCHISSTHSKYCPPLLHIFITIYILLTFLSVIFPHVPDMFP